MLKYSYKVSWKINVGGVIMTSLYELTEEQMFEVYKHVKRNLQRGYYYNRSDEQIAKRNAYMREYRRKKKEVM